MLRCEAYLPCCEAYLPTMYILHPRSIAKQLFTASCSSASGVAFSCVWTFVVQLPFLEPLQPYATSAIDFLAPRPYLLYGLLLVPAVFLLVAISSLLGGKKVSLRTQLF